MQRPGKIKNMKEKIHARARKVLFHGIVDFVSARGSGLGEVCGSRNKFNGKERRAEREMILLRVRGPSDLGKWRLALLRKAFGWKTETCDILVVGVDRCR